MRKLQASPISRSRLTCSRARPSSRVTAISNSGQRSLGSTWCDMRRADREQPLLGGLRGQSAQVQLGRPVGRDLGQDLLPAVGEHHRPQHAVALDEPPQGPVQPRQVEPGQVDLEVEVGGDRSQLHGAAAADPVGLLDVGERERPFGLGGVGRDLRQLVDVLHRLGPARRRGRREPGDGGRLEEGAQRQLDAQAPRGCGTSGGWPGSSGRRARRSCRARRPARRPGPRPRGRRGSPRWGWTERRSRSRSRSARAPGRALRSTLPLGVSGKASRGTTAAGTMYSGRCSRAQARSSRGSDRGGHHVGDQAGVPLARVRAVTTACATAGWRPRTASISPSSMR